MFSRHDIDIVDARLPLLAEHHASSILDSEIESSFRFLSARHEVNGVGARLESPLPDLCV